MRATPEITREQTTGQESTILEIFAELEEVRISLSEIEKALHIGGQESAPPEKKEQSKPLTLPDILAGRIDDATQLIKEVAKCLAVIHGTVQQLRAQIG